MRRTTLSGKSAKASEIQAEGRCVCGAVRLEIDVPAVWAWHDHSQASRHAQGAAYATYVGSWRSRFRMLAGEGDLVRYEDLERGTARSFCGKCGTPMLYERPRAPEMVNIPRGVRNPHRPRATLSSEPRGGGGLDLAWGDPCAAQGISGRDVGKAQAGQTTSAGADVGRHARTGMTPAAIS